LRYERPQKGRTREFFQWNIDLIGVDSAYADAELVTLLAEFFRAAGLTSQQVIIKVNHRGLMEAQIQQLGVEAGRIEGVYRLIDKIDKLSREDWAAYGRDSIGLSDTQINRLRDVLGDRDLWKQSGELTAFFEAIRESGVSDFVEFDPAIIRGLAYYTGTVFEAWDRGGEGRSINGGGRYNNLLADVGGDPLGAVGFALGDVMIGVVLEQYGLKPALRPSPTRVLVTVFSPDLMNVSARIASQLRAAGVNTELYPEAAKLDRQLKYANALGIPFVVIVGPDEAQAGKATVRDLVSGQQQVVDQDSVSEVVRDRGLG